MAYVSPEATLPVVENAIRNWKAYADSCYCHDKEAALKTVARLEAPCPGMPYTLRTLNIRMNYLFKRISLCGFC